MSGCIYRLSAYCLHPKSFGYFSLRKCWDIFTSEEHATFFTHTSRTHAIVKAAPGAIKFCRYGVSAHKVPSICIKRTYSGIHIIRLCIVL